MKLRGFQSQWTKDGSIPDSRDMIVHFGAWVEQEKTKEKEIRRLSDSSKDNIKKSLIFWEHQQRFILGWSKSAQGDYKEKYAAVLKDIDEIIRLRKHELKLKETEENVEQKIENVEAAIEPDVDGKRGFLSRLFRGRK